MNLLKPIFFSKYRPVTKYSYPDWKDISLYLKTKKISILTKETSNIVKGIVVLCHPQLVEGKQFFVRMGHDQLYRKLGFHTIIFDYNGFGESDDRGLDFDIDVHEVLKVVKQEYPNLPIVIHGVSFGGSQLITGVLHDQKLVNKIVIENAISSTEEYYKHRNYKLQYRVMRFYYTLFPNARNNSLYYDLIGKIKNIPTLFIYGSKDVKTPVWMGEKLYSGANEPKQFEIFNTGHLLSIEKENVRYESLVKDFTNL